MVVIAIGSNGVLVLLHVVEEEERAAGNVTTLFHSTMERTASDPHWKQSSAITKNARVSALHVHLSRILKAIEKNQTPCKLQFKLKILVFLKL